jgi:hypothetical protein
MENTREYCGASISTSVSTYKASPCVWADSDCVDGVVLVNVGKIDQAKPSQDQAKPSQTAILNPEKDIHKSRLVDEL